MNKEKQTLANLKAGRITMAAPIYKVNPYVVLSSENVVLAAGTLQDLMRLQPYFDAMKVEVREHDLDAHDNTKIATDTKPRITLERVGAHDAAVFNAENGSRIIMLEDSIGASGPQRLAYREMARLLAENSAMHKALDRIRHRSWNPDTAVENLEQCTLIATETLVQIRKAGGK